MLFEELNTIFDVHNGFSNEELTAFEQKSGFTIPEVLRVFYEKFGKHSLNQEQNRLVLPQELYQKNGYWVFYVENQEVVEWGIWENDLRETNPNVYETYDGGETWETYGESVETFLKRETYFQVLMGGYPYFATASNINKNLQAKIIQKYYKLPIGDSFWDLKLFGNQQQLIGFVGEMEKAIDLWIACKEEKEFLKILDTIDIQWDYTSLEK
ncbi:MAG: hypothetical protein MUC49_09965 [Raineya sp.]|jgi:hypothetical protein|nr:hypothetical protein [Raineya sp.]